MSVRYMYNMIYCVEQTTCGEIKKKLISANIPGTQPSSILLVILSTLVWGHEIIAKFVHVVLCISYTAIRT